MARSPSGESLLERVVRIFEAFTSDEPALSVSQVARRARLHPATASRLIAGLESHGLLARSPDRRVRIGTRMWELALRASPALTLREAAMPYLEDAHAVLGQHVQLGLLDGADVIFVERLSAPGAVVNYSRIAGRLPLHASSAGLVLLAYGDPDLQEQVLSAPLARFTAATLTEPGALRAALAEVRRQGFASLPGHVHEDAKGIAVPLRDGDGRVRAALSAIVPVATPHAEVLGVLATSARGISRALAIPAHSMRMS